MDKLETIKQACWKANPEILELKFGCIIQDFFKGTGVIVAVQKIEGESDCYDVVYFKIPLPEGERSPRKPNWEILGRPIRLADVLLAIPKEGSQEREERYECEACSFTGKKEDFDDYSHPSTGFDMRHKDCKDCGFPVRIKTRFWTLEVERIVRKWNLLKDSLENQSQETIDFLYELLK